LKSKNIKALLLAALVGLTADPLPACGPDFPNYILENGGAAVLAAPRTDFYRELDRLRLAPQFRAVVATNDYSEQNIALEQADLLAALKKNGVSDADAGQIAAQLLIERIKLQQFSAALNAWSNSAPLDWDGNAQKMVRGLPVGRQPAFPAMGGIAGLPDEFASYFDGAIDWNSPLVVNKADCRRFWELVLALPPAQRHFKSVAAAFMLGKAWAQENPDTAVGYFQQARTLAKSGFADSAGLAAASLGEEARLELKRKQFVKAINLYLGQFATGDLTAPNSLQFAAGQALMNGDLNTLNQLAADRLARRVITAYLISRTPTPGLDRNAAVNQWLAAIEAAGVPDAELAEEFALAAYQAGQWDTAQRWTNLAPGSPTAQWLQVKLLLRAGKLEDAAAMLAVVSQSFPVETPTAVNQRDQTLSIQHRQREYNQPLEPPAAKAPATLEANLSLSGFTYHSDRLDAPSQVLGELGVLHLARREYTQSLDALLRSGFWKDAAYVAERVLSVDELKNYVDANWSITNSIPDTNNIATAWKQGSFDSCREIRYLLARRMTRSERGVEAGPYYPVEWRTSQATLLEQLAIGRDSTLSPVQRFSALVSAAAITRTNGMELIGTEVDPDWHVYNGNWEDDVSTNSRAEGFLPASKDELNRAARNGVVPEKRLHYRYQALWLKQEAAQLAWEAVQHLPDNSDEAARMLATSGRWLDQKFATACYQLILHRFGKTEIGAETARTGTFPKLDENGRVIRRELNAEDYPVPGKAYVIHAGDTLFHIAAIVSANGAPMTVADILQANRNLNPNKIYAGVMINIPGPESAANELLKLIEEPAAQPAEALPDTVPDRSPVTVQEYCLCSGDSLARIAQVHSSYGRQISVRDILAANPGLDPTKLKAGQKIIIPIPQN